MKFDLNKLIYDGIVLLPIIAWIIIGILSSPKWKGKRGEKRIKRILEKVPNGIVLNDLLFKTESGYCQIDHILISPKGIFVIETKNDTGRVYGSDTDKYWIRYGKNGSHGDTLYNPVWQNKVHAKVVKNHLKEIKLKSRCVVPISVFMSGVLLFVKTNNILVFDYQLLGTINKFTEDLLTPEMVQKIAQVLQKNNITDKKSRRQHIENCRRLRRAA